MSNKCRSNKHKLSWGIGVNSVNDILLLWYHIFETQKWSIVNWYAQWQQCFSIIILQFTNCAVFTAIQKLHNVLQYIFTTENSPWLFSTTLLWKKHSLTGDLFTKSLYLEPHENYSSNYILHKTKLLGDILVSLRLSNRPSVCLSICPSIHLAHMPYLLCNAHSAGWILSILGTNDH